MFSLSLFMVLSSLIFKSMLYYWSILFFSMLSCSYFSRFNSLYLYFLRYSLELFFTSIGRLSLYLFNLFAEDCLVIGRKCSLLWECLWDGIPVLGLFRSFYWSLSRSISDLLLINSVTVSFYWFYQRGIWKANCSTDTVSLLANI